MYVERDMREWCRSFKSSRIWLDAVKSDKTGSSHTQIAYCKGLKVFCDWIGKNPDQLITEREVELENKNTKMNAENKLREFCNMLEEEKKVNRSTVVFKYHAVVKSFYRYNDLALKLGTPKYASKGHRPHTIEELKTLMNVGDVRERCFMMILKDSGISREDVVTIKYKDIRNGYELNQKVILINIIRQKEQIEYETLIGQNGVESLRAYLDYRQRMGETISDETPLLATISGEPMSPTTLSQVFVRLSEKVGFMTSPHRFRKFFETHIGMSAPSILVKYWMGHSLGVEKAYFGAEFLPENQRRKYAESYKEIDLFKTEISEIERRKQQIIDLIRLVRPEVTDQELGSIKNFLGSVRTEKELEDMTKKGITNILSMVRKKRKNEDVDCQKIINEEELQDHLAKGWRFVATLPSGKIVVTNE